MYIFVRYGQLIYFSGTYSIQHLHIILHLQSLQFCKTFFCRLFAVQIYLKSRLNCLLLSPNWDNVPVAATTDQSEAADVTGGGANDGEGGEAEEGEEEEDLWAGMEEVKDRTKKTHIGKEKVGAKASAQEQKKKQTKHKSRTEEISEASPVKRPSSVKREFTVNSLMFARDLFGEFRDQL